MINWPKLTLFIIATIMVLANICMYIEHGDWLGILCVLLLYGTLILVALYDIGKDL